APAVAPRPAAVLGTAAAGRTVARPPAAVVSKPVVAKLTPPPAPAPFAQRQALLAKNPGRPIPIQQQHQLAQSAPAARPAAKVVTQAKPVTPQVVKAPAPRPGQPGTVAQQPG